LIDWELDPMLKTVKYWTGIRTLPGSSCQTLEPAVVLNGQEPPNKFKRFHQLALLVFVDSPQESKDFASVLDFGVKFWLEFGNYVWVTVLFLAILWRSQSGHHP
jgi:hypothetical protein